jgi:RNA polymerase-binding transcription factor DksA
VKRGKIRWGRRAWISLAKEQLSQLQNQIHNLGKRNKRKQADDYELRQNLVDSMTNWQRTKYSRALAENGGPLETDRIIAFTKMKRITYG